MQRSVSAILIYWARKCFMRTWCPLRGLTIVYMNKLKDEKHSKPQELQEIRVDHLR